MPTPSLPLTTVPARSRARVLLEFARYFGASAVALAVDTGLFRGTMALGLGYPVAAMLGFVAGAGVAYAASVWWVFSARTMRNATLEFALFAGIGLLGLLLTEALLWIGIDHLGLAPVTAKLLAAGAVFLFNFVARKLTLFRAQPAPDALDAVVPTP